MRIPNAVVVIVFSLISPALFAATIEAIGGGESVKVDRAGKALRLEVLAQLMPEDIIITEATTVVDIRYPNRSLVRVSKNSRYILQAMAETDSIVAELLRGAVRALVPETEDKSRVRLQIKTPQSVVGVHGTEFFLSLDKNTTELYTLHGEVSLANRKNPQASQSVLAGKKRKVVGAAAPSAAEDFSSKDLLRRLEDKKGIFGDLADRVHGFAPAQKNARVSAMSKIANAVVAGLPKQTAKPQVKEKNIEESSAAPSAANKFANLNQEQLNAAFLVTVMKLNFEDLKELQEAGAELNARDEDGNTALHIAVMAKYTEDLPVVLAYLLEQGLSPNTLNRSQQTPLLMAVAELNKEDEIYSIVEALLAYKADKSLKDKNQKTALELAHRKNFRKIIRLLGDKH